MPIYLQILLTFIFIVLLITMSVPLFIANYNSRLNKRLKNSLAIISLISAFLFSALSVVLHFINNPTSDHQSRHIGQNECHI